MKYSVIGTWKMAEEGIRKAKDLLMQGESAATAIIEGVSLVEDNPNFHSVGYGGKPDQTGHVVLDGGFMDGDTLHFGGVASLEGFRSPVRIAYSLIEGDANNLLVGDGARQYALKHNFEQRDNLTEEAYAIYLEEAKKQSETLQEIYDGHDTVCFVGLDQNGTLCTATSTSGLFMKKPGRIGDTAIPGSGFYADSKVGAASATGMGEEIMKGALSYQVVQLMKAGLDVQTAAEKAVYELSQELIERNGHAQPMSLVALDKEGRYGVGTNVEFPFVIANEEEDVTVLIARPGIDGKTIITKE